MTTTRPLTDLLGETRAKIVESLQRSPLTAGQIAGQLDISASAVRRHLGVLATHDLVGAQTVRDGSMGRPEEEWRLTARAKRLFVDRSSEFADELLDHVQESYGREAVVDFLRQRSQHQADRYSAELVDMDDPAERVEQLARSLSDDGFAARVTMGENGRSLTLLQSHCAIEAIAKENPEVCAHEAALFKRLLGTPEQQVKVSRRTTIASGGTACVCHIELPVNQDLHASPSAPPTSNRSS